MTSGIKAVIYPVKDLDRANALYGQLLGADPDTDEPYYVRWSVDGRDDGNLVGLIRSP